MTAATEHCAKKAVIRLELFVSPCEKVPNSMHRRNPSQPPRTTRLKKVQTPIRPVSQITFVQIVIRCCFRDSEIRLDFIVRSINPIISSDNLLLFGLMKSLSAFSIAFDLQRPGRPSKNCCSSPSSSKDSNVHHSASKSILLAKSKA